MKKFKSTIVFLLLILFISCDKDDSPSTPQNQDPNPTTFAQNFGNEISRDFLGTVIDKNRNPIENVAVTIGSDIAMTDANGVFIIRDATVNERFGYVKAEKAGYIFGSRSVVPSSGTNKITIMLLEETIVGTTNSGTSETITLPNGASVALEGEYIKEDGTPYSGSVNVILHHLDATDEDLIDKMPGMLYAANAQNEERMLQTFGMLAVELRGENGEDLNLAENSEAEIKIPLDPSLVANAPATIPLWYFEEAHGYWIEDGEATLVGNDYVGTVTHFSFWNCDIPAEAVNLCVTLTDENGNLLNNLNLTITNSTYGTRGGNTNENGEVCGLVPSNETLEINAYINGICAGTSLYTASIGPFSTDSSISIIVADNPDIVSETVIGNFNTCNENPVSDGYVQLKYANQTFTDEVSDGTFEINLLRCSDDDTFKIKASDYVNLQTTDSINYTFTTPLTNLGTIQSCNAVAEFIQYTIDNEDVVYILNNIYATFTANNPNINGSNIRVSGNNNNSECFYLDSRLNDAPYLGTYDHYDWNTPNDIGFNIVECLDISNTNNNIIYNLNVLGNIGEYIDINFSGDYEDFEGNPHSITGVIHVLRTLF